MDAKLRHDIKNQLTVVNGGLESGATEEARMTALESVDAIVERLDNRKPDGGELVLTEEIVKALKSADNEGTRSPYWLILDPRQNMSGDIYQLASQISGPFFCRKDAQDYLDAKSYHFTKKAIVFCHSGHFSKKYEELCDNLKI